jgi:cation:H+ antiporter
MSLFFVLAGLVLLVIGGEFLVRSSVGLSFKLNISKLVIGMTVVSFATSAPELIVSIQAAFNGYPDLTLGNVIGSNIANIALVLGVTILIMPLIVDKDFFTMNWPMMLLMSLLLYGFLISGNELSRWEGFILVALLITFLFVIVNRSKNNRTTIREDIDESLRETAPVKIVVWLLIGGVSLWFGSELLVKGATEIAQKLGVSDRVIGLSMVALGTSIPELAASVIAALRQEKAISLGNLIGSNIFNIGAVLGITSLINPIPVTDLKIINHDILWMLGIAIVLIPLVLTPKKRTLSRWEGVVLLVGYMSFIYLSFLE